MHNSFKLKPRFVLPDVLLTLQENKKLKNVVTDLTKPLPGSVSMFTRPTREECHRC
jgi:hypothetical protein